MIYGHEQKKNFFKNLISRDALGKANFGHAYLFFGEPQIGKYYFAKHLSYFLEYGKFDILESPLLDALFIEPEEKGGKIGVGKIKEIKRFLFQKPFHSNKRLVVMDKAENMTPETQAGLLKIVEESPSHGVLIFIAGNPQSLLPPLTSRLQKVYFSRLSTKKIKDILIGKYDVSEKKAEETAKKSFGRLGRAFDLINGKEVDDNGELEEFIEKKILSLFIKDKFKNSKIIKWLTAKEVEVKRFSTNPKLQKKVIEAKISKY